MWGFSVRLAPQPSGRATVAWVGVGNLTCAVAYLFTGPHHAADAARLARALGAVEGTGAELVRVWALVVQAGQTVRPAHLWAGDELALAADLVDLDRAAQRPLSLVLGGR